MKYSIAMKFIAFLLAACTMVAMFVCGGYALMLERYGLYDVTPAEKQEQWYAEAGYPVAWRAASEAAAIGPGGCSQALAEQLYGFSNSLDKAHYYVVVRQEEDVVHTISNPIANGVTCEYTITPQYPKVVNIRPSYSTSAPLPNDGKEQGSVEMPTFPSIALPGEEPIRVEAVDVWEDLQKLVYELYYYDGPTYTVHVSMAPEALKDTFHSNLTTLYPYRYLLVWGAALALILTAAIVVFLICAAGRTKDGALCPAGFSRMPVDVFLVIACILSCFPLLTGIKLYGNYNSLTFFTASLLILCGVLVGVLVVAVVYVFAAQIKLGKGYWWRHSVVGMALCTVGRGIAAWLKNIRVFWRWLLLSTVMLALTVFAVITAVKDLWNLQPLSTVIAVLCVVVFLAIVSYGGYCFAVVLDGATKMSQGMLQYKIPIKRLKGGFRDCAEKMNTLSETTMQAVQNQVRAERMKTELITNVSHDIKTPLTSIINFVDLLGKPHTEMEQQQYLEVLSRQSLQLKKLIEDLMELSKANSGNITANITVLDAAESVNQALGEFADKMEKAHLTPVFRIPEEPMRIAADGRLTWRVLSNLLSNAVKYATPGTRIYLDLSLKENQVCLSIKNISREELCFTAEELLERFVQGDPSRNREGSGLGLNIAKSLMEVQHGSLQLLLDGDLFKVTLLFPKA